MRSRGPISAYDEMELAVIDMRERFLSIGEHIAGLLAALTRQIDAAPAQTRPSIRHAAAQIAGTQERLRAQMDRLPPRPEERYQIMRSLLQAQQGALQQLSIIVERNVPQGAAVVHQMHDDAVAGRALAEAHFERGIPDAEPMRGPARRSRPARPAPSRPARRGGGLVQAMGTLGLAVLAIMAMTAAGAYLLFSGAVTPEADHSRPTAVVADKASSVKGPAEGQGAGERKSTPLPTGTIVTFPQTGARQALGDDDDPASLLRPGLPVRRQSLEADGADPAEPGRDAKPFLPLLPGARQARPTEPAEERGPGTSAASKPAVPEAEPARVEPAPLRFVAVISTHKERPAALDAFSELQRRYPAVLGQRRVEAQPIETAAKGTWHRLVVLPAGPRRSAAGVCSRLLAAGYDRCWVTAY